MWHLKKHFTILSLYVFPYIYYYIWTWAIDKFCRCFYNNIIIIILFLLKLFGVLSLDHIVGKNYVYLVSLWSWLLNRNSFSDILLQFTDSCAKLVTGALPYPVLTLFRLGVPVPKFFHKIPAPYFRLYCLFNICIADFPQLLTSVAGCKPFFANYTFFNYICFGNYNIID